MQNLIITTPEQLEVFIRAAVRSELAALPVPRQPQAKNEQPDEIGGIELAVQITGYAKPTIYSLVSQRLIPHAKPNGKRLIFNRADLLEWIKSSKRKTVAEITAIN